MDVALSTFRYSPTFGRARTSPGPRDEIFVCKHSSSKLSSLAYELHDILPFPQRRQMVDAVLHHQRSGSTIGARRLGEDVVQSFGEVFFDVAIEKDRK